MGGSGGSERGGEREALEESSVDQAWSRSRRRAEEISRMRVGTSRVEGKIFAFSSIANHSLYSFVGWLVLGLVIRYSQV